MTKDIGVVFLPNDACRNYALHMNSETARALPKYTNLKGIPHITAFQIANQDDIAEDKVKEIFTQFYEKNKNKCMDLPVKEIKATGGSDTEGYKWLDLQFETSSTLNEVRDEIVDIFCPLHNGTLTRMADDMDKFTEDQKKEIQECGVTYSNYIPHITTWYVDLPNEPKTIALKDLAKALEADMPNTCTAKSLALVELGRNGNALNIIEQYELCVDITGEEALTHSEL